MVVDSLLLKFSICKVLNLMFIIIYRYRYIKSDLVWLRIFKFLGVFACVCVLEGYNESLFMELSNDWIIGIGWVKWRNVICDRLGLVVIFIINLFVLV